MGECVVSHLRVHLLWATQLPELEKKWHSMGATTIAHLQECRQGTACPTDWAAAHAVQTPCASFQTGW